MPDTTEDTQVSTYAASERQAAGPDSNIPVYRFSCVYLTSCSQAADLASTLAAAAQIRILRANSLDNAKARLLATKARVILVDVSFEKGEWEDAVRMAARLPLRVALVLVSRFVDHRLWIDALEGGAYDVIFEPFQADELRYILGNAHLTAISGSFRLRAPRNEPATDHAGKQSASSRKDAISTGLKHERAIGIPRGIDKCQLPSIHTSLSIDESSHSICNSSISDGPHSFVVCPPDRNSRRHRIATLPVCPESIISRMECRPVKSA
jgi:response regulator of citrate/malate metabolism